MKIIVIGLGSMGRRRIRLIKKINPDIMVVGVDTNLSRCRQVEDEFGIQTIPDLKSALDDIHPDCVIISTPPLAHAGIIEQCLREGCNVFTELNLVSDGYAKNITLAKENNKILFISSTFLYREEIKYITQRVQESNGIVSYIYHVGQYLPDWHPWEQLDEYFVSNKRTNGCRELFAIELPWIIQAFGNIVSCQHVSDKMTELPVSYNDNYMLILSHENGNKGVLVVDVVSRKAVRNLEVYSEDLYLTWDGTPRGLMEYDHKNKESNMIKLYDTVDQQSGYEKFIVENGYQAELEAFFDMINGRGKSLYTFEDDYNTLKIIDKIEIEGCI